MDCMKRKCVAHQVHCTNVHADFKRVIEWMNDPKRKPAMLAFTAGPERNIGYAFEYWVKNVEGEKA